MTKNTLAWFVTAGAAIALSGMGMAACSSSSATGNPSNTTGDGGDNNTTDGGNKGDGSAPGDAGSGGDSGGKGDAGKCTGSTPFIPEAGTPNYCFGARSPEDAGNGCSGTTPSCCDVKGADGGFANNCVAQGSCVGVGTDGTGEFQCQDNSACGGQKCCIARYSDWDGGVFTNTCGKFYGGGGTKCQANCDDTTQVCSSNADCPTGQTCTASKVASKNLGVCLP